MLIISEDGLNTSTCPPCTGSLDLLQGPLGRMAQPASIRPEECFGKGDSTLWTEMPWASQRPQAVKNLKDPKIKLSSFASIMRLASRSRAACQFLRDLLSTWLSERTQQPPKPLLGDSCTPYGHRCHCAPNQQGGSSQILCCKFTV